MIALNIIWIAGATLAILFGLSWVSILEEPWRLKLGAGLAVIAAALTWPLVALAAALMRWENGNG